MSALSSPSAPRTLKLRVIQEPVEPRNGLLNAGSSGNRGWHSYGMMLICPQAWSYRFNLGLTSLEMKSALIRGTLVHVGLAHLYEIIRRVQQGEDPKAIVGPLAAVDAHTREAGWTQETAPVNLATFMVRAYVATYGKAHRNLPVVGAEQRFTGSIEGDGAPVPYTQRLDLVTAESFDEDAKIDLIDWKTSSRVTKSFDIQFQNSGQMIGMRHLARGVFGARRVRDVLVGGLQTEPFKVERFKIAPSVGTHPLFLGQIVDAARRIEQLKATRDPWEWPRTMSDTVCFGRYGSCQYLDLCTHGRGMASMYAKAELAAVDKPVAKAVAIQASDVEES